MVFWLLLQCALLIAQELPRSCPEPELVKDEKYHPGQIWEYKTRPDERSSRLTILKIESLPKLGTIVHVRIDNVRLKNCAGGPEPDTIQHMPFMREAIEHSVSKLQEESDKIPDLTGYDQWRADCGGVYTITVAEAIQADEYIFNKGLGCQAPDHASEKTKP